MDIDELIALVQGITSEATEVDARLAAQFSALTSIESARRQAHFTFLGVAFEALMNDELPRMAPQTMATLANQFAYSAIVEWDSALRSSLLRGRAMREKFEAMAFSKKTKEEAH